MEERFSILNSLPEIKLSYQSIKSELLYKYDQYEHISEQLEKDKI